MSLAYSQLKDLNAPAIIIRNGKWFTLSKGENNLLNSLDFLQTEPIKCAGCEIYWPENVLFWCRAVNNLFGSCSSKAEAIEVSPHFCANLKLTNF